MKKILFLAACILTLAACKNGNSGQNLPAGTQNDSLQIILQQKDNEINEMMSLFNEIEEGFRLINEAENNVNLAKDGEGSNKADLIRENIKFIQERMKQNRDLIAKLRQQLKDSSINAEELQKSIDSLMSQLEDKNNDLKDLRAQLEAKDIHITELDNTVNSLSKDIDELKSEGEQKTNTINTQDKQLNTAWYVFGTKSELKDHNILVNGKVLQSNFDKSYFTKIDIRETKEIKLYSKSVEILTTHPSGSYSLTPDLNKQYILRISNPQLFWSTSKYLVVQVK
ncbi:MAG: hypothetical protein LUC88_09620 [Prevotella sp.]|nr:hypothetical protein [Prevotella sp.]